MLERIVAALEGIAASLLVIRNNASITETTEIARVKSPAVASTVTTPPAVAPVTTKGRRKTAKTPAAAAPVTDTPPAVVTAPPAAAPIVAAITPAAPIVAVITPAAPQGLTLEKVRETLTAFVGTDQAKCDAVHTVMVGLVNSLLPADKKVTQAFLSHVKPEQWPALIAEVEQMRATVPVAKADPFQG